MVSVGFSQHVFLSADTALESSAFLAMQLMVNIAGIVNVINYIFFIASRFPD